MRSFLGAAFTAFARTNNSITTRSSSSLAMTRAVDKVVPATFNGKITRLVGTLDMDGNGTNHPLADVDPFILLDAGKIGKPGVPSFGAHPHRGHSVVSILLNGKVKSWDSFKKDGDEKEVLSAPASYWVDAGSGVFHDERSVMEDENDPSQHMELFQLWVGVSEADRKKPARIQYDTDLPKFELKDTTGNTIGSGIYYVGEKTKIETPHPISVALIKQNKGTTYRHPVVAEHGGFVVHTKGNPSIGGTTPENKNDVLVLKNDQDGAPDYLEIQASDKEDAEYLVCAGERIKEKWVKKLVANGAIIAATEEEAKEIAPKVEAMSKSGKEGGSFAPFGAP